MDSVSRQVGFSISQVGFTISTTNTQSQHLANPTANGRDSPSLQLQKCVDVYIVKHESTNSIYISLQLGGIA